jgi:hypothetical protein
MNTSENLSALALIVSLAVFLHSYRKSRRDERRAVRAEQRFAELERKQHEEDERRTRSEAPYLVATKLWGGTKDSHGMDLSRLVVTNEGRDCLSISCEEATFSLSQGHIRKGETLEIIYQSGVFQIGHITPITFRFETSSGHRSSHKYQIGIGRVSLRRIEPSVS